MGFLTISGHVFQLLNIAFGVLFLVSSIKEEGPEKRLSLFYSIISLLFAVIITLIMGGK